MCLSDPLAATGVEYPLIGTNYDGETTATKNELYLCRYRSRKCLNVRARKRNGELHRLCQMHRIRANTSQRKLHRKRRSKLSQSHPVELEPLTRFDRDYSSVESIFSDPKDMELFLECLDLTWSSRQFIIY